MDYVALAAAILLFVFSVWLHERDRDARKKLRDCLEDSNKKLREVLDLNEKLRESLELTTQMLENANDHLRLYRRTE